MSTWARPKAIHFVWVCMAVGASVTPAVRAQQPRMTNGIGMEFVLVNPGEMIVGKFEPPYLVPAPPGSEAPARGRGANYSPEQYKQLETLAKADYRPGFVVRIPRPYYIGRYEVTQAQWRVIMGSNPSMFQGAKVSDDADQHPVDNVTWSDALAFVKALNAREKTSAYRLPTEFEWEYAARAGNDGNVAVPPYPDQAIAGFNTYFTTQAVGQKKPNAWNLYDMLGNVWEWVADYDNGKFFADPTPPRAGKEHVLKGGSFLSASNNTIPAIHAGGPGSGFDVGFRVVRDPQ